MPDGPRGSGDTENGVAVARVAAGGRLASPITYPRQHSQLGIAATAEHRKTGPQVVVH